MANPGDLVATEALTHVGAPYVYGAKGPSSFDCCLTGDTLVSGPDMTKRMDETTPGDVVWSWVDGRFEPRPITAAWQSKYQPVFRLRTQGRAITASANHPFLRVRKTGNKLPIKGRGRRRDDHVFEWCRLDELSRGDMVVVMRQADNERTSETDLDYAWLLGLIIGDGSLGVNKKGQCHLQICVYGPRRDRAAAIINRLSGCTPTFGDSYGLTTPATKLVRPLVTMGLDVHAHKKRVPACVWGWSSPAQRAFLDGYCAADGHIPANTSRHGERTYASCSADLIREVRMLHILLGDATSNVSTHQRTKPITINGVLVKNARPLHTFVVWSGHHATGAGLRSGYMQVHEMAEHAGHTWTIRPILGIDPAGEADTYDLEVADGGNFIADGIVVHNSGLTSFCWRVAGGVTISPGSQAQWTTGTTVTRANIRPGDILCYDTDDNGYTDCSHVGIYIGPGQMVNAFNEQAGVRVDDPFSATYFLPRLLSIRRIATYTDSGAPTAASGPATVTGSTPWRGSGSTSVTSATAEFRTVGGSPLIPYVSDLLAAAGDLGRLMLAISKHEQQHSTYESVAQQGTYANSHNFLSLAAGYANGAHTWYQYPTFAACVADWRKRLLSTTGPYKDAVTISDIMHVYAPSFENDTQRYIDVVCAIMNRNPPAGAPTAPAPAVGLVFGKVPLPTINQRDISGSLNTAWDDLGPRKAMFVVLHRMLGSLWGTDSYFRNEARFTARTDYGMDHLSGETLRWTNPLGNMSPWASGPWTAPPGDGVALVQKYGVNTINRDGVSIEIAGSYTDPLSTTARDQLAKLIAYWADQSKIPWDQWPISPRTGLTFIYWHSEFNGGKDCPGPTVKNYTNQLIEAVRDILKAYQGSGGTATTPSLPDPATPPPTQPPVLTLPPGVTQAMLSGFFGTVTINDPGGDNPSRTFNYTNSGTASAVWAARGTATGKWPQLTAVSPFVDAFTNVSNTGTITVGSKTSAVFRFEDSYRVVSDEAGVRGIEP